MKNLLEREGYNLTNRVLCSKESNSSKAFDPTVTVAAQCLTSTDFGAFDLNF